MRKGSRSLVSILEFIHPSVTSEISGDDASTKVCSVVKGRLRIFPPSGHSLKDGFVVVRCIIHVEYEMYLHIYMYLFNDGLHHHCLKSNAFLCPPVHFIGINDVPHSEHVLSDITCCFMDRVDLSIQRLLPVTSHTGPHELLDPADVTAHGPREQPPAPPSPNPRSLPPSHVS